MKTSHANNIHGVCPNGAGFTLSKSINGVCRLEWHAFNGVGSIGVPLRNDAPLEAMAKHIIDHGYVGNEHHPKYFAT